MSTSIISELHVVSKPLRTLFVNLRVRYLTDDQLISCVVEEP